MSDFFIYGLLLQGHKHKNYILVKLGSTLKIERRKWDYQFCFSEKVKYLFYFPFSKVNMLTRFQIEKKLAQYLLVDKKYYNGGGTEFYRFNRTDNIVELLSNIFKNEGYIFNDAITIDTFDKRPEGYKRGKINNDYVDSMRDTYFEKLEERAELRYYQKEAIEACLKEKVKRGQIICAPGTGKSLIQVEILKRLGKGNFLILVPSLLLVEQMTDILQSHLKVKIIKIDGSVETVRLGNKSSNYYISTYQSCHKLEEIDFEYIFHDEAHLTCIESKDSNFKLMLVRNCNHLFFTGTERVIKKIGESEDDDTLYSMNNDEVYGKVLYKYDIERAIKDGYLTDFNIRFIQNSAGKTESVKKLHSNGVISHPIIFCRNRDESKRVYDELKENNAFYIDGKTPRKEREEILTKFKESDKAILVNCQVLCIGIDLPICDGVIFYSERKSSENVIQIIGRCLRLYKNKYRSNVIILLENNDENTDEKNNKRNISKILKIMMESCPYMRERVNRDKKCEGTICKNIGLECDIFNNKKTYTELIYDRFFNWDKRYEDLIKFITEEERMPKIKTKNLEEKSLSRWVINNKTSYTNNKMSRDNIEKLEKIEGWYWKIDTFEEWKRKYLEVKNFVIKNERNPFGSKGEEEKRMSNWVHRQKEIRYKLTEEQEEMLESIPNWFWSRDFDELKETRYRELKEFIETEERYPSNLKDGSLESILYNWFHHQRSMYKNKKITEEEIDKLELLPNWEWEINRDEEWDEKYDKVLSFVKDNNRLPQQNIKEEKSMGKWVSRQKSYYKNDKLSRRRIKKLEKIKCWNWGYDDIWNKKYGFAKRYLEDDDFKYTNEEEKKIKKWICHQKEDKEELTDNKKNKLESIIGWEWFWDIDKNWDEVYKKVNEFIEKNAILPPKKEGTLYNWIVKQRGDYKKEKLSRYKIDKLKLIKIL